jgi:cyclic pyranopterin phosphate synthase
MQPITDTYGRKFKTLRVSLLSRCNLSCTYCTMGEDVAKENNLHQQLAAPEALLATIQQLHNVLQLKTIRLTGGEPLLYPQLPELIEGIVSMGVTGIKLTTNGLLLQRMAKPLKDAGMRSVNISLDAVDEDVFFMVSKRNHLQRVLDGIDAAIAVGLEVKINSVIMKGVNDSQVIPLLEYAFEKNIPIRFLEVMAMGHLHGDPLKYLFTQQELLSAIETKYSFTKTDRAGSATSNYWQTTAGHTFGIIANESEPFCHDCDRLRLDSEGNIYGCLSSNHPISLKNTADQVSLISKLQQAMLQKQAVKFVGSELSMLHIGG